jgi:hypothetical protein
MKSNEQNKNFTYKKCRAQGTKKHTSLKLKKIFMDFMKCHFEIGNKH